MSEENVIKAIAFFERLWIKDTVPPKKCVIGGDTIANAMLSGYLCACEEFGHLTTEECNKVLEKTWIK